MPFSLNPPHRLARINYAPRVLAFGYTYAVLWALVSETGGSTWILAAGAVQFLVYPHLAYLHARLAADSKRAELRNLFADSLMLGGWAAQMYFALWPTCGILAAVCLNGAASGGWVRLVRGATLFAVGALAWGFFTDYRFDPQTSGVVSALSAAGLIAYTAYIGQMLFDQNTRLLRTRNALRKSEEQFRYIAEHAGDFVAVLDPALRFRYASNSHARHFRPDAYAPGAHWLDLVHPDDRDQARHYLELITSSGAAARERVHLRMISAADSWQVLECQGNAVRDEGERVQMVVLILRDVGARVRTDIERQLELPVQAASPPAAKEGASVWRG